MVNVKYESGQSRYDESSVDYMMAEVENKDGEMVELYFEVSPEHIYTYDKNEYTCETKTYEYLKNIIIAQAINNNVDPSCLKFYYD